MKAIVLAAGLGTRLRPLTEDRPKCMLPVDGRPLMAYTLELLIRHKMSDVFVNLYWHPDLIEEYFGDGEAFGLRIHYLREEELSGTAGPLRKLADELAGERFLLLYGDNLTDLDLSELVRFHDRTGAELTVALHREDQADLLSKSAVDTSDGGRVLHFVEKPAPTDLFSLWASAGIYVIEPSVIRMIPEGVPYDIGHDVIPALLRQGRRVFGYKADFYLVDIGTPQGYARAQAHIPGRRVS